LKVSVTQQGRRISRHRWVTERLLCSWSWCTGLYRQLRALEELRGNERGIEKVVRRKATAISTGNSVINISDFVHHTKKRGTRGRNRKLWVLTARMAGSSGTAGGGGASGFFAASSTLRSFTSDPRKTIYSNILSDGGTSSPPRRPSVPNERTIVKSAMQVFLDRAEREPSYLVREQRLIRQH